MRFLSLLAAVAVLMLSGCNTLRQHNYEKILVRTPGVDNAYCDLYTDRNRYGVMTSRQVLVERSELPITVICRKTGYYTASVIIDPEISAPGMPLNVANGFFPGAAYDVASNSVYAYPDTVTVILLPEPAQHLRYQSKPYVLQKKPEPVYKHTEPKDTDADESLSKSGEK